MFDSGLTLSIEWPSLNPQKTLSYMKTVNQNFPYDMLEQYMKRAGITTGYTEKPCLDPKDPKCPDTAPNKQSQQTPDIGAELTGGCYSYATKYMHWPEELIVGGVERNRTRHLKSAKALQTVIQLMTEREMYESWKGHYKVHQISWTPEKAGKVLSAWQSKFANEVRFPFPLYPFTGLAACSTNLSTPLPQVARIMKSESITKSHDIFAFSSSTLDDILGKYSNLSTLSLCIDIGATLVYAVITLMRWKDPIRGQSAVGIAGVLLIGMATAAGLGLCALLGRAFNAATTQVVPFLALGLGVDHIFVLTAAYAESDPSDHTKNILKKAGPTILLSSSTTIASFFAAALIPVPALKIFCLQSAIVMCFNLAASLLVFPAIISLDLRRRASGRSDFFCCCLPPWKRQQFNNVQSGCGSTGGSPEQGGLITFASKGSQYFSLSEFAYKYYAPFITQGSVKFFGMLIFFSAMILSLFNAVKLEDGLDLFDLVPKNTNEHKFLNVQSNMFGFYNMFAVTQGDFEYPTNQKLLHEYHEAFVRVPHVIKNDNGGLPEFWLSMFRDWLVSLQAAFDRDFKLGTITQEHWYRNASTDGILAYKLLVQTGHVDNPVDKTLVMTSRLVDTNGIVNPKAFYNYLSAWASNDVFSYSASQVSSASARRVEATAKPLPLSLSRCAGKVTTRATPVVSHAGRLRAEDPEELAADVHPAAVLPARAGRHAKNPNAHRQRARTVQEVRGARPAQLPVRHSVHLLGAVHESAHIPGADHPLRPRRRVRLRRRDSAVRLGGRADRLQLGGDARSADRSDHAAEHQAVGHPGGGDGAQRGPLRLLHGARVDGKWPRLSSTDCRV